MVVKSLGQALGSIKGISGGAILGDGNVGLIVDVSTFVALAKSGTGNLRPEAELAATAG